MKEKKEVALIKTILSLRMQRLWSGLLTLQQYILVQLDPKDSHM